MIKLLLLAFSVCKFGKLLTSGGTTLLPPVVYAFIFGWRYAAGFIALLFVHGMGGHQPGRTPEGAERGPAHLHPLRRRLDPARGSATRRRDPGFYVGLGGLAAAAPCGALLRHFMARSWASWLLAVAYSGLLFEPARPDPRSRPSTAAASPAALAPRIWFLGVPVLGALFWWRPSPMLLLIALLARPQLLGRPGIPQRQRRGTETTTPCRRRRQMESTPASTSPWLAFWR